MQICIHRGANEIGGSCIEVVSNGQKIILDLGLPLDVDKNDVKLLPNIPGLLLTITHKYPCRTNFYLSLALYLRKVSTYLLYNQVPVSLAIVL